MSKIPTPAMMALAAFSSATVTGILGRYMMWFSGYELEPETVFSGMAFSATLAMISVAIARAD